MKGAAFHANTRDKRLKSFEHYLCTAMIVSRSRLGAAFALLSQPPSPASRPSAPPDLR